jgi:hypothetical protein
MQVSADVAIRLVIVLVTIVFIVSALHIYAGIFSKKSEGMDSDGRV